MRFWSRRYASKEDTTLGEVLTKMRVCTEEEVRDARERQAGLKGVLIGEVLIEMGCLTTGKLSVALELQRKMRNGKAAEAMLEIVEYHTHKTHSRVTGAFLAVV
jgi:hypothetical protein